MLYLDSSALAKFVAVEPESESLHQATDRRRELASAALARVEVTRVGRLHGGRALAIAEQVIGRLEMIPLDDRLLERAARLAGSKLKSLDALHVAAAQTLSDELEALITYDRQMQDAARELGLPVAAPGQGSR